jgi:flagellar L-ring protein precursor FlgH
MVQNMKSLMIIVGLLVFSACSGIPSILRSEEPVAPRLEMSSESSPQEGRNPPSDGSLWKENGYRSLFRDLRARQVGDLVTVNIVESSKANKKANTKTSRESSINGGISNVLGWEDKIKYLTSLGNKKVGQAYNNEQMFKASMKNEYTGEGETSRDETMTASITARVIDLSPEGNLLIRGTREVKVNNETQFITLTGFIRPEDISPDNTVLSSYIADAKIAYSGSGPVSDKQRPGWLMRFVDFVWPF